VSITIVAVVAFYLPAFSDTKGANIALVGTTFISTAWFLLGDPFGISDIYVALLSPLILMLLWKMFEIFTKNTGNKALHQEK
jgi:SSS family solute:Na+ symporter